MGALSSIPALGNPVTPKQFYRAGKGVVVAGDATIVVTPDDTTGKLILTAPGVDGAAATASWGGITGTLSDQSDLQAALTSAGQTATWAGISGKPTTLAGYGITDEVVVFGAANWGTVTQPTSKSTGVELDTLSGQITMSSAALAAGALVTFVVTNSKVSLNDAVVINIHGPAGAQGNYGYWVTKTSNGSFAITIQNLSAASRSDALSINFAVLQLDR